MNLTRKKFYRIDGVSAQYDADTVHLEGGKFALLTVRYNTNVIVFEDDLARVTLAAARCIVAHQIFLMALSNHQWNNQKEKEAASDMFVAHLYGQDKYEHMFSEMSRIAPELSRKNDVRFDAYIDLLQVFEKENLKLNLRGSYEDYVNRYHDRLRESFLG